MKSDARAFFASSQDPSFSIITDMSQQFGKGNFAAATSDGWALQKIVAHERLSSAQGGTSADGARYVIDVFNCMSISLPLDTAFTNHAADVLALGVFEIRGDVGGITLPAWAWLSVNGARTAADPAWGVEPAGGNWPTTGAFLIYGYPKTVGVFIPTAAVIDQAPYNAFELGTVPATGLKTGFRVGVCVSAGAINGVANRLLHNGSIQVNSAPTALCVKSSDPLNPSPTFANNSAATGVRAWFASLFTPNSAFAQSISDFTGGTPDGWSPFGTGALSIGQIALAFTTQPPANTFADSAFTVAVQATIPSTTNSSVSLPVPGVTVTLSVANNSGTPAGATLNGNVTGVTDGNGNVTFTRISVGKAGGYTILASGSISGVATQSVISNQFQVQNK